MVQAAYFELSDTDRVLNGIIDDADIRTRNSCCLRLLTHGSEALGVSIVSLVAMVLSYPSGRYTSPSQPGVLPFTRGRQTTFAS
jgi:hypothetical protein